MTRNLVQTYNIRISYSDTEILLFEDEASRAFYHVKLHLDFAVAQAYSVGQTLRIPIGSIFGSNVIRHNWEVFAQSRFMLAEHFQASPDIKLLLQKHKALLGLFQPPTDLEKYPHFLVPAINYHIIVGVFSNGKQGLTKNTILVDVNLLADTWAYLLPVISTSADALFTLLGQQQHRLRNSPLSMDEHKESECSYVRRQIGILVNTRELTIGVLDHKWNALEHTLRTIWNPRRRRFMLREIAFLLGLASNLALTTSWGKHTCISLQRHVPRHQV